MRPRHATKGDLPDVKALLQSCTLPSESIGGKSVQFLVSREKTSLLGCIGAQELDGKVALLRELVVAERARRAGLAALMVSVLVADLRMRGIESLVVSTNNAVGYFSRLGFTPVDRKKVLPESLASQELSNGNTRGMVLMRVEL